MGSKKDFWVLCRQSTFLSCPAVQYWEAASLRKSALDRCCQTQVKSQECGDWDITGGAIIHWKAWKK